MVFGDPAKGGCGELECEKQREDLSDQDAMEGKASKRES